MPVGFFSKKLTNSQLNWTAWDKELYGVVAALQKWVGLINFKPVEIWTDHQALRHWETESVDTPTGHFIFSRLELTINYIPGLNGERDEFSVHGSLKACLEVAKAQGEALAWVELNFVQVHFAESVGKPKALELFS